MAINMCRRYGNKYKDIFSTNISLYSLLTELSRLPLLYTNVEQFQLLSLPGYLEQCTHSAPTNKPFFQNGRTVEGEDTMKNLRTSFAGLFGDLKQNSCYNLFSKHSHSIVQYNLFSTSFLRHSLGLGLFQWTSVSDHLYLYLLLFEALKQFTIYIFEI